MKQELTITIDVPDGYKAYWDGDKVAVIEADGSKPPKTWEEFCKSNPIKDTESLIDSDSSLEFIRNKERDVKDDRNALPSKSASGQHLALMQLHQLRDCYRQGWVPDWDNEEEGKYCIVTVLLSECEHRVYITRGYPRFLSFQTSELAEMFLSNFKDLIQAAGDLI